MFVKSAITELNECSSNPCLNGGACIGKVNGYTCECCAGYTGELCETGSWNSHSLLIFLILFNKIDCQPCIKQMIINLNLILILDISECDSDPCENGGNCTDDVNGYTCSCANGWTGSECQFSECF